MPLAGAAPLPGIDLPKTEFGPGPAPIVAIGIAADTISCPNICEAVTGSAFRGAIFDPLVGARAGAPREQHDGNQQLSRGGLFVAYRQKFGWQFE
jgi:hypothetical protein